MSNDSFLGVKCVYHGMSNDSFLFLKVSTTV